MLQYRPRSRFFVSFLLIALIFPLSAPVFSANADELVIKNSGEVILVIPLINQKVLGKVDEKGQKKQEEKPEPKAPVRTEILVPAQTKSTVQINPTSTTDQKINVTITTPTPKTSQNNLPSNVIKKTVDRVVAEDAKGQAVLTIKSGPEKQITFSQKNTEVTTNLPLQIDTLTHIVSTTTQKGQINISVLPDVAVSGVTQQGLINNSSSGQPKVSLIQDRGQPLYTISAEKEGKLFGVLKLTYPVQIKLSAQTGKVIGVNSLFGRIFGPLLR